MLQMVWAETYLVGCGYAFYKDPSLGYTKIYVCNYAPGGNVIGGSMYKLGFPGQQYCVNDGLHPSHIYEGLCDRDAVTPVGPCGDTPMHGRAMHPVSNSIASGHHSMMMPPPPPPTHHHSMLPPPHHPDYLDHPHDDHDLMRPSDFLVKGIHEPFMGLVKMFNPLNIINRFTHGVSTALPPLAFMFRSEPVISDTGQADTNHTPTSHTTPHHTLSSSTITLTTLLDVIIS
ncbi:hypothetical protein Pmani_030994 [Petrolisthes manimaculis]|uniref:SCP domain-containing protein n=1 Tax=Petrolisthes manimaculis TaxID=1843537 RepID=A0AAE1NUT0_9EUCA|nr:hypothetical protein Pmani_030994 [Petrolisthes manimaculis]